MVTCTQEERNAQERQRLADLRRVRTEMGMALDDDGGLTADNAVPDVDPDNYLRIPTPETIPRFETDEEYSISAFAFSFAAAFSFSFVSAFSFSTTLALALP